MTGSGKTHMMFGDIYNVSTGEAGVSALAINEIFAKINKDEENSYKVNMSYLEIYNEQVKDLLCAENKGKYCSGLLIVEDPIKGVIVPELTEYTINSVEDLLELTLRGNQARAMGETRSNQFSSRSHAIISISIESQKKARNFKDKILMSKFFIVDLAGSERAAVSDNKGIRMHEGGKINKSLLALGNCINMLRGNNTGAFIPYRDSKLTRLLKDSLGGNTKTVMIACISPGIDSYEGTINTLKYAQRAKRINKTVVRNVKEVEAHIGEYKNIINSLKTEIDSLKKTLKERDEEILELKERPAIDNIYEELKKLDNEKLETEASEDVSAELIVKSEEQYEMKQSLKELNELSKQNNEALSKLQGKVDATGESEEEIRALKENMKRNEEIQRQIEESLELNIKAQRQLIEIAANKSHKNDLSMQLSIKTLSLEKAKLAMQNQQLKKISKEAQEQCEEKDKELEELRKELERTKKELGEKTMEIDGMKLNMKFREMQGNKKFTAKKVGISKSKRASRKDFFNITSRRKSPVTLNLRNKTKEKTPIERRVKRNPEHDLLLKSRFKTTKLLETPLIKKGRSSPKIIGFSEIPNSAPKTRRYIRHVEDNVNINKRHNTPYALDDNRMLRNQFTSLSQARKMKYGDMLKLGENRSQSIESSIGFMDRSNSLNSKMNLLKDRRILKKRRHSKFSLDPMRELIEDMSQKLQEIKLEESFGESTKNRRSSFNRNGLSRSAMRNTDSVDERKAEPTHQTDFGYTYYNL